MHQYCFAYTTITTVGRLWLEHKKAIQEEGIARLSTLGAANYGLWAPQFGLASNQCVLISCWPEELEIGDGIDETLLALDGVAAVQSQYLEPTVRPTSPRPPGKPGLYVHRWFQVETQNIDEIVALSAAAWVSFEENFDAEVIGLFRNWRQATSAQTKGHGNMLLLNWYPNLAAWETSREIPSDPVAWDYFQRRRALTNGTWAASMTLVVP